jgi:hypothetical protein
MERVWGAGGAGGQGKTIINYQLSIINYQLSIINYQLSIINYQLSIIPCAPQLLITQGKN